MKRYVTFLAIAILMCLGAGSTSVAQTASPTVDFSGTWEFVGKGSLLKKQVLTIEHSGNEMNSLESFEFDNKPFQRKLKLFTDKRGERNLFLFPGADSEVEVLSKTYWKKDKLVRQSNYVENVVSAGKAFSFTHRLTETYSLSADGNTLSIEFTAFTDSPFDPTPRMSAGKKTYRRKSQT